MARGRRDRLSGAALDVARLRCAPACRARAFRRRASQHAAHPIGLHRPAPRAALAVARIRGTLVRRAGRTAARVSLGTRQPPWHPNRVCDRYLAQHGDSRCEARPADARQARHRRFHQSAGRRRHRTRRLCRRCVLGLPHHPRLRRLSRVAERDRHRHDPARRYQYHERHSRSAGRAAAPSRQRQGSDPGHRRRGLGRRCTCRRAGRGKTG
jgi:hypothetical protein